MNVSVPQNPADDLYCTASLIVSVSVSMATAVPIPGVQPEATVLVIAPTEPICSGVFSTSTSFNNTGIVTGVSSVTAMESSAATGISFSGVTVTVTVAVSCATGPNGGGLLGSSSVAV